MLSQGSFTHQPLPILTTNPNTSSPLSTTMFCKSLIHHFKKLYQLDKSKHLDPKFSIALGDLVFYILKNKEELLREGSKRNEESVISMINLSEINGEISGSG